MEKRKITKEDIMEFTKKHWKALATVGACGACLLVGRHLGMNAKWLRSCKVRYLMERHDDGCFDLATISKYAGTFRDHEHGIWAHLNPEEAKYVMQYFLTHFKEDEVKDIVDTLSSFKLEG